eukprot:g7952.t1
MPDQQPPSCSQQEQNGAAPPAVPPAAKQAPSGAPPAAKQEQGWVQWTERGKMYLSRHEKNVFVLEGTTSSGVAACKYTGTEKEEALLKKNEWSLVVELKSKAPLALPQQPSTSSSNVEEILLLLDAQDASDLSSGCDFAAVKLQFGSNGVIKVENRRKTQLQTLFSMPTAYLRDNSYLTLRVDVSGDRIFALVLNGMTLVQNLDLNRPAMARDASRGGVGIATYGRSRVFMKRFKIEAFSTATSANANANLGGGVGGGATTSELAIVATGTSSAGGTAPGGSLAQYGGGSRTPTNNGTMSQQSTSSSATGAANLHPPNPYGVFPAGGGGPIGMGSGAASTLSPDKHAQIHEELELAHMIERDLLLPTGLSLNFDDIGGLESAKTAINEAVVLPLLVPEFFTGIRKPCTGVLLYGPPGTGKTMLAKAVASTATHCATLTSKWRGESEKLLRSLFNMARHKHPSILFFDEIDSLLSQRGGSAEHEASRRFKSEFLIHMDGVLADGRDENRTPLVLCTSNAPWDLDDALKRRLEKRIYIALPDETARRAMIAQNVRDIEVAADFDALQLAKISHGYSGADLKSVCREASMAPLRRGLMGLTAREIQDLRLEGKIEKPSPVLQKDFLDAFLNVQPSVAQGDVEKYEAWTNEFGTR